ncbi:alkaline phosphatase [Nitzschia inconspicua]|uniref:Alkaline phosphatase n=1 Tax=Nitzschia inconspicua TaxID=303405 RepID=A0A9K3PZD9_9STRA|nr:alkaline phosphatase [Nitzschia inconspicua]
MAEIDDGLPVDDHLDPEQNPNMKRAVISTSVQDDWVVKVDVQGLEPATKYLFAFVAITGGESPPPISRVGMTRTAPAVDDDTVEQVQFAVFSCAHFSNGYFHAYDIASTLSDIDFWIHMGDYIYEYGTYSTYATGAPERHELTDPIWEIVDLNDYRRRYAQYHTDEGLQNLRARAPLLSTWDDHETTNDSHGDGNPTTSGAENHQPTCPVNRTSPDEEKEAANCDRDEGSIDVRMNHAAQAYMEWMPIRKGPFGTMGFIETDLTQVMEWGNLATVVMLDTRMTSRSAEPTGSTTFGMFGPAFATTDVSLYTEEPLASQFQNIHTQVIEKINNPNFTMIGSSKVSFLEETFAASKTAGKPWQIFGCATMMGPSVLPNPSTMARFASSPEAQAATQALMDAALPSDDSALFRAAVAMSQTMTPWNLDDYNGFGYERKAILDMFRDNANNGIILGGDLHDNWAWKMYEGGAFDGNDTVAINLGAPGVTNPGWGSFFQPLFASINEIVGGDAGVYEMVNAAFEDANPGLVYGDVGKKGFFVVTLQKEEANIEYFGMSPTEILVDCETARAANGDSITAAYTCGARLISTAGEPGSLVENNDGCITMFESERPALWDVPVPLSTSIDGVSTIEGCGADACIFQDTSADTPPNNENEVSAGISVFVVGMIPFVVTLLAGGFVLL